MPRNEREERLIRLVVGGLNLAVGTGILVATDSGHYMRLPAVIEIGVAAYVLLSIFVPAIRWPRGPR